MRRPYYPKMKATWWLQRRPYTLFMLRELSAVFVAGYALLLLVLGIKVYKGGDTLAAYLDFLDTPGMLALHAIIFIFAVLHTVTWFNSFAKAVPIWRGEERLAPWKVTLPNYVALLVLSALVALLFLV